MSALIGIVIIGGIGNDNCNYSIISFSGIVSSSSIIPYVWNI